MNNGTLYKIGLLSFFCNLEESSAFQIDIKLLVHSTQGTSINFIYASEEQPIHISMYIFSLACSLQKKYSPPVKFECQSKKKNEYFLFTLRPV